MKRFVSLVLRYITNIVPDRVWLLLLRLRWGGVAFRKPSDALRFLLKANADLKVAIDRETIRYDNGIHVKHRLTRYHDFFVDRIRPNEKALDIGCGNGAVAYDVAVRAGAHVIGIDLNPDNIAAAKLQFDHPRLTFQIGDALGDLPHQHFDCVILSNVLEHLPGRPEFLRNLTSATNRARLLIRVPLFERDWQVPLRKELGLEWRSDGTHEVEYTIESFAEEMLAAGLKIKHQEIRWGEIWAELEPM